MNNRVFFALPIVLMATGAGATARAQDHPAVAARAVAETPATRQALRLLDALSTGDDAAFLAFIHEVAPRSKLSDSQWLDLRPNLRRLAFHGILSASPTNAELSVFDDAREAWARFLVTVEAAPPYAITDMSIRGARRPADVAPPPRLAPDALVTATKARLEREAAADRFSGAVLIVQDSKPLFTGAYGLADRETRTPVTPETQFRYGSIGKMFTAVAIMQLAQAGKVDLAAPVGRYLPDYPNPEVATKVTIEHLLTHTGGTGDIFGPQFDATRLSLRDPKDYVALYDRRPPEFAPGSRLAYSNYGFILLGRIVEAASGGSYDDYLRTHIYGPAHMASTGAEPETAKLPRRATGYTRDHGGLTSVADTQPYRGTPAGGGYSTVGDLARFMDALGSGVLLDTAHRERLTTGGIKGPDGTFYRYDFGGITAEGLRYIGHAGGAPGMNGEVRTFPDLGFTIVVLSNRDPSIGTIIASFISDRLPERR